MKKNHHHERNPVFWERKGKIPIWLISEKIGVSEQTLMRWLRVKVEEKRMEGIMKALEQIREENDMKCN